MRQAGGGIPVRRPMGHPGEAGHMGLMLKRPHMAGQALGHHLVQHTYSIPTLQMRKVSPEK